MTGYDELCAKGWMRLVDLQLPCTHASSGEKLCRKLRPSATPVSYRSDEVGDDITDIFMLLTRCNRSASRFRLQNLARGQQMGGPGPRYKNILCDISIIHPFGDQERIIFALQRITKKGQNIGMVQLRPYPYFLS